MGSRQGQTPVRRVVVIGGPCGKPIKFPNSKVKRGWSQTKVKWRFEKGELLPPAIPCGGEWYVLRMEGETPYYVHALFPPPPEPPPEKPISPMIVHAIGAQRYWLRQTRPAWPAEPPPA